MGAVVRPGRVAFAQVGDTCACLLRGGCAIQVTNEQVAAVRGAARSWAPETADELVRWRVGAAEAVRVDVSFAPCWVTSR